MSSLLVLALALAPEVPAQEASVPQWGRWEASFTAEEDTSPDTDFSVELTSPSGRQRSVSGFWDGGRTWRVRFLPDEEGTWRFRSRARRESGLDGQAGRFSCRKPDPKAANPLLRHGPVVVSANGRHLQHLDGTPFFWLGDTVWTGPALSARDDWDTYLKDRVKKHFSAVQFNTLCPWRAAAADAEGKTAFDGDKKVRINPSYFRRLDARIDAINAHGLLAAPVLVWAHKPDDPGNALPEADVVKLLRYQVARYGAHHVLWVLAGDNDYKGAQGERWRRIGYAVFGNNRHPAPVTTHPTGMNWPWADWRDEGWLTVLGYQSGHGDNAATLRWLHSGPPSDGWRKAPARPVLNLEPPYEDHVAYQSHKPHGAYNVRRAVYWSLLSTPPAGVTYGAHGLWSWQRKPDEEPPDHKGTGVAKTWREALDLPGSTHVQHAADLFRSLPWWQLRPYQDLLAAQPGGDDPAKHVAAAWSDNGDLAVIYLPVGGEVRLKADRLVEGLKAEWFDPRTGKRKQAREDAGKYRAPDEEDWVLVLRRAER
ncbi:MAG TPA: DUF4038 domain-containing protein [Gemmataceae bacterium]|nr:DUF4038 domain-containing protein [Gemmataceae bacterium]